MPAFRLDDLGWFEFEQLAQTLLKARLGLGVEAWGGRGDWGRDAYFEGVLKYPAHENTQGPFLFQCKFVEEANAPGAQPASLLLDAVRKERHAISSRLSGFKAWPSSPKHYALLTNSPASPDLRAKIIKQIKTALPACEVHIHDGNDLSSWLRLSPEISRSFPQLLSLRDLKDLLADAVNSDTLNRSQAAIDFAQGHARIFVPTNAYTSAQERLHSFGFVVLIGPPEMGKTTIGRIIALSQLCAGWEALECRSPQEILRNFKKDRKQVFVADDFFGRTEYEPMKVSEWQAELAHILPRLDSTHWLILTSRAHLLEFAKTNLDIDGQNHRFPNLGEVIVDASKLTSNEKARILYRHAKSAQLNHVGRLVIKENAEKIVKNPHFTPERIRRLVEEVIPKLTTNEVDFKKELDTQIRAALTNPTKQMRVSFRLLPPAYRWLLFALLDVEQNDYFAPELVSIKEKYVKLCPPVLQQPFETVVNDLSEAFIRKINSPHFERINWVHPSCRDLAIEELSINRRDREQFLSNCSDPGLLLALSLAGGDKGERALPLLQNSHDWEIFVQRVRTILALKPNVIHALWMQYTVLIKHSNDNGRLKEAALQLRRFIQDDLIPLIHEIIAKANWQQNGQDTLKILESFVTICGSLKVAPQVDFAPAWKLCQTIALKWESSDWVIYQNTDAPERVFNFLNSVNKHGEDYYKTAQSSGTLDSIINPIIERIRIEADNAGLNETDSYDDNQEAKMGYETLADICRGFSSLTGISAEVSSDFDRASSAFEVENPSQRISEAAPRSQSTREVLAAHVSAIKISDLFKDL